MATDIGIALASTEAHFAQILSLQRRYHVAVLPDDVQSREGFLFVEHTLPLLARMAAASPQAIALHDGRVVGYCLSLPPALQADVPVLAPMFEQFGKCEWRGRPVSEQRYVVGGQVCVDRAYRGQGLLARLYRRLGTEVADACELCVTEIATRNGVSVRAHGKMGFEAIGTYSHGDEDWVIVAWELGRERS